MTLNGIMALILRYFTEFGSFCGPIRQSVVEDCMPTVCDEDVA